MARKIRKDITVGALEKKLGVVPGTFKNPDGRDTRSDKKLETLQKEQAKTKAPKKAVAKTPKKKATVKKTTTKKAVTITRPKIDTKLIVTADQKTAAKRTVKSTAKTSALVRKITEAMKTSTKK